MTDDPTFREPDQIRQDCARKLGAVKVSNHIHAILGWLHGEDWTTSRLVEMVIAPGREAVRTDYYAAARLCRRGITSIRIGHRRQTARQQELRGPASSVSEAVLQHER